MLKRIMCKFYIGFMIVILFMGNAMGMRLQFQLPSIQSIPTQPMLLSQQLQFQPQFHFYSIMDTYMNWMAQKIKYSSSGCEANIEREGVAGYMEPDRKLFYRLNTIFFDDENYTKAFKMMIEFGIGDCGMQSVLLMIMLAQEPIISNEYSIYCCASGTDLIQINTVNRTPPHQFVLLIKKDEKNIITNHDYKRKGLIIKGSDLISLGKNLIVLDPWRNIRYVGVSDKDNPRNYTYQKVPFSETRMDVVSCDDKRIKSMMESFNFKEETKLLETIVENSEDITVNQEQLDLSLAQQKRPDKNNITLPLLPNVKFIDIKKVKPQDCKTDGDMFRAEALSENSSEAPSDKLDLGNIFKKPGDNGGDGEAGTESDVGWLEGEHAFRQLLARDGIVIKGAGASMKKDMQQYNVGQQKDWDLRSIERFPINTIL